MGIAEARETIRACQFCFMCRYACPTFLATKLESVTPRGYALILGAIDQGHQSWTGAAANRFYQCSLCGLCKEDCEYHWPEDETVRRARQEIVKSGFEPEPVRRLIKTLFENGSSAWTEVNGLPAGVIGKQKPEVLYLAGSQTLEHNPEVAAANVKILSAMNVDWGVLELEESCGVELFDLGCPAEAKQAAQKLAGHVSRVRPKKVITGCSHTYRTLKEHYPAWQVAWPEHIPVLHTSEYFSQMLAEGQLKLNQQAYEGVLSYHDPCQLGRKMGVYEAPRGLIKAATGAAPTELFHNRALAECCGAGSVMHLTQPDTALKVAQVRLDRVAEEKSDTLVTACQNCKAIFARVSNQNSPKLKVMELSEFLALYLG